METLILEAVIALVMIAVTLYVWRVGRSEGVAPDRGWSLTLTGLALISVGAVADVTDHFPELGSWPP